MSKINIRGVIVPSGYDAEWAASYIEKGMFTPESVVRSQISAADKEKPLKLYINSPGGSVFAGNEMINAINEWAQESGQNVEITVGAMAASMAAGIIVSVPATVSAHKNSKIMFHGAWGGNVGGSESMADAADLLDQINGDIKAALVSRTSLSAEEIDEWFAEGREGWLNTERALEVGLIDDVVDGEAEAQKITKAAINALSAQGYDVAALEPFAEGEDEEEPGADDEGEDNEADEPEDTQEAEDTEPAEETEEPEDESQEDDEADEDAEDLSEDESDETTTGEDTEEAEEPSEEEKASVTIDSLSASLEAANNLVKKHQARCDKATAEADKLRAENEAMRAEFETERDEMLSDISDLQAKLKTFALNAAKLPEQADIVSTWDEALAACGGDYVMARREYNEIWRQKVGQ